MTIVGQPVELQKQTGCLKKPTALLYKLLKNKAYSFKELGAMAILVRLISKLSTQKLAFSHLTCSVSYTHLTLPTTPYV